MSSPMVERAEQLKQDLLKLAKETNEKLLEVRDMVQSRQETILLALKRAIEISKKD